MESVTEPVNVAPGIRLAVRHWGRRDGPALVLLHGFASSTVSTWAPIADRLAVAWHVIALDLRGHGESDWDPEARYGLATHAADVDMALSRLGLMPAAIVGHSMGGRLALLLASRHRSVRRVAVVDSRIREGRRQAEVFMRRPLVFASMVEARDFARHLLRDRGDTLLSEFVERADGTIGWRADVAGLQRARVHPDPLLERGQWEELESLGCPVLVFKAGRSRTIPADDLDRLASLGARVRVVVLPDAHHGLHLERPDAFFEELLPFLRSG